MKICKHCNAANKDSNHYCVECSEYLSNSKIEDDQKLVDEKMANANAHSRKNTIISYSILLTFYILYNVFMAYNYYIFGEFQIYLTLLPLYIPCLVLFFFPYDKTYNYFRKKRNRPERHLSDFVLNIFRSVGVIYLLQMFMLTYDKFFFTD